MHLLRQRRRAEGPVATGHDSYLARQGVEYDGMNVLILGGYVVDHQLPRELMLEPSSRASAAKSATSAA